MVDDRTDRPVLARVLARERAPGAALVIRLRAACVATALVACVLGAGRAGAHGMRDVAGTLNGEPVTLGEIDTALDGTIGMRWAEIDAIVRETARSVCADYATIRIAAEAGLDVDAWRAEVWRQSRPTAAAVRAFVSDNRHTFDGRRPEPEEARHLAQVHAYRRAVATAIDRLLDGDYTLALSDPPARFEGEPVLPQIVAQCLGHMVTRHEVEAFAALRLHLRRADVVAASCRQFDIDYSNPVVLHRMARARGVTVEALMHEAEGGEPEVSEASIDAAARARYGSTDEAARERARLALVAERKVGGRMAFLEKVREETEGECTLDVPPVPMVTVRGGGPGTVPARGLRVSYFGAFRCEHCAAGWQAVDRLRRAWGDDVQVDVRHHFSASAWLPFKDAAEAHCAAWAGRLWEYVSWRTGDPATGASPVQALDLEPTAFAACLRDPTTAVAVLADGDEAARLGFRGAVPSWVIGHYPRRGLPSDQDLHDTVRKALDAIALVSRDELEGVEQ